MSDRVCRLEARGRVVHRTRRLLFAEAALLDGGGAELARGSVAFAPSAIPLDPRVGYR